MAGTLGFIAQNRPSGSLGLTPSALTRTLCPQAALSMLLPTEASQTALEEHLHTEPAVYFDRSKKKNNS